MRKIYKKIGLVLITTLSFFSWAESSVQLTTEVVSQITVPQYLRLDGQVQAINQTTLAAQTSGQITDIFVEAGDVVAKGDLLLTLQATDQKAQLDAAKAQLDASKAEYIDAKANYQRIEDLIKRKLTSQQSLDNASARLQIAKAQYNAAKARLASAKQQVAYTQVKAPYAGIVLERHVDLGEVVNVGSPLFTGTSLSALRIETQIPQQDLAQVQAVNQVVVQLPNGSSFKQSGEAIRYYAYAMPQTNAFKVRISLPKNHDNLYPGMYVKVRFVLGERKLIAIPETAVVKKAELRAVYVLNREQQPQLRQIRLGEQLDNGKVEVLAGLKQGEQIILSPEQALIMLAKQER